MMYVAKPKLNNTIGQKSFSTLKEAVAYLEEATGHKMDYVVDKRTKERIYDWELVGKLKRVKT